MFNSISSSNTSSSEFSAEGLSSISTLNLNNSNGAYFVIYLSSPGGVNNQGYAITDVQSNYITR